GTKLLRSFVFAALITQNRSTIWSGYNSVSFLGDFGLFPWVVTDVPNLKGLKRRVIMKGYIVAFSDDTTIEAIPDDYGVCKFSVDDTEVSIVNGVVSSSVSFKSSLYVTDVKEAEVEKGKSANPINEEGVGVNKRTCITCGSRYYCATNGCINSPCGWVCG